MDGVFMLKYVKVVAFVLCLVFLLQLVVLTVDSQKLRNSLIRLHVVANSDSEEDQNLKLTVKDAIVSFLEPSMLYVGNKTEAMAFLQRNLQTIKQVAVERINAEGYDYPVSVTLTEEAFSARNYDTFSLPAGVYDSLRVNIGQAEGKNWWCVAFPMLCMPATSEAFVSTATEAGLPKPLSECLADSETWRIRFFLLESIGNIQIFLEGK